jgi:uncharacterized protein YndB with AHSA1/START domain
MLAFLKWTFLLVILIVAGLAAFVAVQPSHFEVQRSTEIEAPPAAVFEQVNDFHRWDAWSPWAKLDPNAKTTFEGPNFGDGAKFSWDGNDKVGAGKMTIVDSKPPESIKIKLEFLRPMVGNDDVLFTFVPIGTGKTKVTWKMSGEKDFMAKGFFLFVDCDKVIGPDYEKGLANLKAVVEAPPASSAPKTP